MPNKQQVIDLFAKQEEALKAAFSVGYGKLTADDLVNQQRLILQTFDLLKTLDKDAAFQALVKDDDDYRVRLAKFKHATTDEKAKDSYARDYEKEISNPLNAHIVAAAKVKIAKMLKDGVAPITIPATPVEKIEPVTTETKKTETTAPETKTDKTTPDDKTAKVEGDQAGKKTEKASADAGDDVNSFGGKVKNFFSGIWGSITGKKKDANGNEIPPKLDKNGKPISWFDNIDVGGIIAGIIGFFGGKTLGGIFGEGIVGTICSWGLAIAGVIAGKSLLGDKINGWLGRTSADGNKPRDGTLDQQQPVRRQPGLALEQANNEPQPVTKEERIDAQRQAQDMYAVMMAHKQQNSTTTYAPQDVTSLPDGSGLNTGLGVRNSGGWQPPVYSK